MDQRFGTEKETSTHSIPRTVLAFQTLHSGNPEKKRGREGKIKLNLHDIPTVESLMINKGILLEYVCFVLCVYAWEHVRVCPCVFKRISLWPRCNRGLAWGIR